MRSIRFYVMEDIPDILAGILEVLEETAGCEVIGSSSAIHTGYDEIIQLRPDALILDITLDGGSAFEMIRMLKLNNVPLPPVIIMTGDPEYSKAGEAVDVIGPALVKLIEKPFWKIWPKEFPFIKAAILARMTQLAADDHEINVQTVNSMDVMMVRSSHMTYRIILGDLLYIDAEKGFSTFVIKGSKTIKVRRTLTDLLSTLPPYICRISRDKAVNIRHLDQIDHESNELFLDGCKENFFIGEPYKASLKTALGM